MRLRRIRVLDLKKARKLSKRRKFAGMDISVETAKGEHRYWYDPHAKKHGKTKMKYDYGYIRRTEGTDGDHVDVYLGPHADSERVFIVNQKKPPDFKEFDEQKVMLGFRTPSEAKQAYLDHYDNPRFFDSMIVMRMRDFKSKVFSDKMRGVALQKTGKVVFLPPYSFTKALPPGFPFAQHHPDKPATRGRVGQDVTARTKPTDEAKFVCAFTTQRGAESFAAQIGRDDLSVVFISEQDARRKGVPGEGWYVVEKHQEAMLVKATKPPAGFMPVKNSKKGGYKKMIGGKWVYWYPGQPHPAAARQKKTKRSGVPGRERAKGESGKQMPKFEASQAEPGTGIWKIENGVFPWKTRREFELSQDDHQMRHTGLVPGVDDNTKMQLISEFRPLLISEAKHARKVFALKTRHSFEGGRQSNETQQELIRAGTEGLLNAINTYKADVPFAQHARIYVRDYVRLHAAREYLGGIELPQYHVRNLARYIRARAIAGKNLQVTDPTPEQVLPYFDLRKKHIHIGIPVKGAKGQEMRNAQIPDREGYKLSVGAHDHVARGRGGERETTEMKDVGTQPSKLEWAEMYDSFLKGQKGISAFDEQVVFPGAGVGYGFSPEDQVVLRNQIDETIDKISQMGSLTIEHKLSGTKMPAQFRIDSLGDVLMRRLGFGDHQAHTVNQLVDEVPVYKVQPDGNEKLVGKRNAHELMQIFVDTAMQRMVSATEDKRAKKLVERAQERIAPQKKAPPGPSYADMLKEEAKQVTKSSIDQWRSSQKQKFEKQIGRAKERGNPELARSLQRGVSLIDRMSDEEVKLEVAKSSRRAKQMSREMRTLMTNVADVERVSPHEGIVTAYDPVSKQYRSVRTRMVYQEDFHKSFGSLTDAMIREAVYFPETMNILIGDDQALSPERKIVQSMAGWY